MSTIKITCDNCGAGYKLPESFKSPKAKCQKCGSVIDVAAQREATAKAATPSRPATAKPAAAARPAKDRSKAKAAPRAGASRKSTGRPGAHASSKAGSKTRATDRRGEAGDDAPRGRRERTPKKKDQKPMIFGLIGLAAIAIVAATFLLGGDGPAKDEHADSGAATSEPPAANTSEPAGADSGAAANATGDGAATPDEPATGEGEAIPTEEPDAKPVPEPAEASAPAPKLPPNAPLWMREKVQTMDQVDTHFPEVAWDKLPEGKKEQLQDLAADYAAGGRPGFAAEKYFREHPWEGLFGLVGYLRTLDHTDPMDTMQAYAVNRLLTEITYGVDPGLVNVDSMDEEMDPRKAMHNCRTTRAWVKFVNRQEDEATFLRKNEERRKAQLKRK